MPSRIERALRVALNRPRVLGVVALAVGLEVGSRTGLALVRPAYALVVPPVAAVLVLGLTLPDVRRAVADPAAPPIRAPWRGAGSDALSLVALSVAGHLLALAAGGAVFLLVDTPIRYAWYAAGNGPPDQLWVLLLPVAAVAALTVVAWGLFAPVALRALDRDRSLAPVRTAVEAAAAEPGRTAGLLTVQFFGVVAIGTALLLGLWLTRGTRGLAPVLAVTLAIAGTVATLVTLFLFPIHASFVVESPSAPRGRIRRLALVGLVLTATVLGVATVRGTETRPTSDRAPLPEAPSAAYATAVENTISGDHRITYRSVGVEAGEDDVILSVDRTDRRLRVEYPNASSPPIYRSTGVAYNGQPLWTDSFVLGRWTAGGERAVAVPAYFGRARHVTRDGFGSLPDPGAGEWSIADRSEETVTVELTGGDAVARAIYDRSFDSYRSASIRMAVDADRGVVTGGAARLNATDGDDRVDVERRWAVESGATVDVRRPDVLGPTRPGEVVWRVLAY